MWMVAVTLTVSPPNDSGQLTDSQSLTASLHAGCAPCLSEALRPRPGRRTRLLRGVGDQPELHRRQGDEEQDRDEPQVLDGDLTAVARGGRRTCQFFSSSTAPA